MLLRNATPHLEGIVLQAIKTNSVPRFQACHKLIHSLQLPADYHCQSTNHSVCSSSNLQCSVAVCGQTTIAHACLSDETDLMRTWLCLLKPKPLQLMQLLRYSVSRSNCWRALNDGSSFFTCHPICAKINWMAAASKRCFGSFYNTEMPFHFLFWPITVNHLVIGLEFSSAFAPPSLPKGCFDLGPCSGFNIWWGH